MVKYKVEIRYYSFVFDNAEEAMTFAENALKHYDDEDKGRDFDVTITLINKEDE